MTSARTAKKRPFPTFPLFPLLNRYVAAGDVSVIMPLCYLDELQLIYNNSRRRESSHCCFYVILELDITGAETNDGSGRVRLRL
jgi:hypothetical protein